MGRYFGGAALCGGGEASFEWWLLEVLRTKLNNGLEFVSFLFVLFLFFLFFLQLKIVSLRDTGQDGGNMTR